MGLSISEARTKEILSLSGVALLLLFPILDSNRYHLNLAILIALYAINAMALNILLGVAGQISLCQSVFYGMGAYVSGILNVHLHFDFLLCFAAAIVASGFLAFLIGLTALRFKGHFLAMVTLAIVIIFIEIVREWYGLTGGPDGFPGIGKPVIGPFVFDTEIRYFYLVYSLMVALIFFGHNLVRGRTGRALSAVRQNETLSFTFGINPTVYKLKVFVLSGLFGGLSGSLYAHYSSFIGSEDFSLHVSITMLCMIVVGGLRSGVWGGFLGAALLTLLPEWLGALIKWRFIPPGFEFLVIEYCYRLILFGLIMLSVTLFWPDGVVGIFKWVGKKAWWVVKPKRLAVGIGERAAE